MFFKKKKIPGRPSSLGLNFYSTWIGIDFMGINYNEYIYMYSDNDYGSLDWLDFLGKAYSLQLTAYMFHSRMQFQISKLQNQKSIVK